MKKKQLVTGLVISLVLGTFFSISSAEPFKVAFNNHSYSDQSGAQQHKTQKVLVLSAPPLANSAEGRQRYAPFAQYLTQVLGQKVIYKHPRNWSQYQNEMTNGKYDLVFDSAHFNSYRVEKLKHNILVKLPDNPRYAVFVDKKKNTVRKLSRLAGRSICAYAPPHLATLMVSQEFKNPMRQPRIKNTEGWDEIYQNVISGKCDAGIVPDALLASLDKTSHATSILFRTKSIPAQALSASPNIPLKDQQKLVKALLVAEAMAPTSKLRGAFNSGTKGFAPTKNREYLGMASLLKTEWGYY